MDRNRVALTAAVTVIAVGTLTAAGMIVSRGLSRASSPLLSGSPGEPPVAAPATGADEFLPCGHRLLTAKKNGEEIGAYCVDGHGWYFKRVEGWHWNSSPPEPPITNPNPPPPAMPSSEDRFPCGHRVQRSFKDGEQLSGECTQGHPYEQRNGAWVPRR